MNRSVLTAGAAFGLAAFALDQATKAFVFDTVAPGAEVVLASFFSIAPGFNSGSPSAWPPERRPGF